MKRKVLALLCSVCLVLPACGSEVIKPVESEHKEYTVPVENTTPSISEDRLIADTDPIADTDEISKNELSKEEQTVIGRYIAVIDLSDRYLSSSNEETAKVLKDADFTFDAVLDIKDDHTAVMNFDIEKFYDNMYQFVDENYVDILKKSMASYGMTDEQLDEYARQKEYENADAMLNDMKEELLEVFVQTMRGDDETANVEPVELTWSLNEDQLSLTSMNNSETRDVTLNKDGSFTMMLSIDEDILSEEVEMAFTKQN